MSRPSFAFRLVVSSSPRRTAPEPTGVRPPVPHAAAPEAPVRPTWHVSRTARAGDGGAFVATDHAAMRLGARRIGPDVVALVLEHGRVVRSRAVRRYFVGRREVARARALGVDLRVAENVHVLVATDGAAVVTAYRNRAAPPRH